MPTIHEQLRADIVAAMKARDSGTTKVLRTIDAAIQRARQGRTSPTRRPGFGEPKRRAETAPIDFNPVSKLVHARLP